MKMRALFFSFMMLTLSCSDAQVSGKLSILGFYGTPSAIISELKDKQNGQEEHFMLGLAYKKQKKYKESIFHFANSCFKSHRDPALRLFAQPVYHFVNGFHFKSIYYNDAVYEIAHLFYLFKEHAYVVKFIDLISSEETVLYRDALLLKARSLASLEKYDDALVVLQKVVDKYPDHDSRSIAYLRIGSLYEKKSSYPHAVENYLKVLAKEGKGWQSSIAARHILQIMEENPQKLDFNKNLLYAKALYHAKKYKEAAAVLNSLKSEGSGNPEAMIFLVRSLARNNEPLKAEAIIAGNSAKKEPHVELLKAYADEVWEMNRKHNALPQYQRLIKTGIEPQTHDSLQRIAQFMEERKLAGYDRYLSDYTKKYADESSGHFLWLMGRNLIRARNMEGAGLILEESVSKYPRGGFSDECRFWLHKIYKDRGLTENAMKIAADLIVLNPDSPYSWLLIKQLTARYTRDELDAGFRKTTADKNQILAQFYHTLLFGKEKSLAKRTDRMSDIKTDLISRYRDLERTVAQLDVSSKCGKIAAHMEKYFRVGHIAGINRELKIVPNTKECTKDKYTMIAHYSRKYNYAYLSVYAYLELLKLWNLKENIALMPVESVRSLFPLPFSDCVSQHSAQYGLEKNILYSVMKAESLFKHNAVSPAGAVGLMQLMPATAKGIARGLKIGNYDLSDPCTSIQIGAKFISGLSRDFQKNFQYVVAAYNAGSGNVGKWKSRLDTADMDYFTEFTPFIETRYYILRTDKFFTQYNCIYNGQ